MPNPASDSRNPAETENARVRIVLVDDEALIREAFSMLIGSFGNCRLVGIASGGEEAVDLVERLAPDLVLMDLSMPGIDGAEATRRVKARKPGTRVIALTALCDPDTIARGIESGIDGYLLKRASSRELREAIDAVMDGKRYFCPEIVDSLAAARTGPDAPAAAPPQTLSPREVEVAELVKAGLRNREIAGRLFISEKTVEKHRNNLRQKLDAATTGEMIASYLAGKIRGR